MGLLLKNRNQTDAVEFSRVTVRRYEDPFFCWRKVEELYPSSRALGADYPLHASAALTNRLKTMLLWANITSQMQLQIDLVGRMLVSLAGSKSLQLPWPGTTTLTPTPTPTPTPTASRFGRRRTAGPASRAPDWRAGPSP